MSLSPPSRVRFPLVALAIFALLAGLWGALLRSGWNLPALVSGLPELHGPLIVSGFLGTLVSVERAVALRARWAFAAPLLSALGALILTSNLASVIGALLIMLGSLGMVAIYAAIVRRQPAVFTYTMSLGAVAWFIGNAIWFAGLPIFRLAQWWAGFLILTIVGERLELARLMRLSRKSETLYFLAVMIFAFGLALDSIEGILFPVAGSTVGIRVTGAGMLGLAVWLLQHDIARHTVRQTELTRFIAWCLLLGYVWLGVGGIWRIVNPDVTAQPAYDAMLHTVFLGFVMSMIFGHAPIILPAVLYKQIQYRPTFYAHLILLHLSLALRIGGDLGLGIGVWQWAGFFNVVAVLLFLITTARALLSAGVNIS